MPNVVHNVGVVTQIGSYGDAIEVPPGARWLFTSGTPVLPHYRQLDGSPKKWWPDCIGRSGDCTSRPHSLSGSTFISTHQRNI